jgi:hypothetical protein
LLAMIDDSSGQSPPEPPRQNPGSTQQRTNTEQRDTDQAPPSFIKKLPAEDTQQKPAADEQKGPENRSNTWALSDEITALASIVALLQFFALVGTVFVLIWTARRQLRAYVFVSSAKIIHGIEDDRIPEAHVVIKNSGQTPAYKLTNVSGLAFDKYPAPPSLTLTVPDRDYLSLVRTRMDLGPGNETSPVTLAKRPLTAMGKISLTAGASAIWVYGEIRYRDVFWRKQWTKYRFMIGGPFGVTGGELVGCEEGNEAT